MNQQLKECNLPAKIVSRAMLCQLSLFLRVTCSNKKSYKIYKIAL